MRETAAGSTPAMRNALVTPNVTIQCTSASNDFHLALIVVAKDATVATAD
jgi:hypothetical protein